jgi:hypothetical protein
MMDITENMIKYFNKTFDINVSTIPMFFKNLDGYGGMYYEGNPGMIFVDRQLLEKHSNLVQATTIVHELTHLIQYEYKRSLSIKIKDNEYAGHYDYWDEDWNNQPLEVDAILSELNYLFFINPNKVDRIINYGKIRFKNTREDVLMIAIDNLNGDKRFINIINTIVYELTVEKKAAVGLDNDGDK